jgi:hypothetical protein
VHPGPPRLRQISISISVPPAFPLGTSRRTSAPDLRCRTELAHKRPAKTCGAKRVQCSRISVSPALQAKEYAQARTATATAPQITTLATRGPRLVPFRNVRLGEAAGIFLWQTAMASPLNSAQRRRATPL